MLLCVVNVQFERAKCREVCRRHGKDPYSLFLMSDFFRLLHQEHLQNDVEHIQYGYKLEGVVLTDCTGR